MKFSLKSILVPAANETREVDAVQLWEVRWTSRHGAFHADIRPQVEAFPTRDEADFFAESLRNAFKVIRHTDGNYVSVKRAR